MTTKSVEIQEAQQHLAELMGIEKETVSRMETGAREANAGYLGAFAEAIGCATGDLFSDPQAPRLPAFAESNQAPFVEEGKVQARAKRTVENHDIDTTLAQIVELAQTARLALRAEIDGV